MKEQFFRFCAVMNFVISFASFGGYEQDMFDLGRCVLQMLFFLIIGIIFGLLAENEYYNKHNRKGKRK